MIIFFLNSFMRSKNIIEFTTSEETNENEQNERT
jgi:hypothetical protein